MALTQQVIAEHLGMSQQAVSDMLRRLGLDSREQSPDEIRLAYIEHLREMAAGRAGAGEIDLATERAMLARSQRERIDMQNAITRREYGPIAELELAVADTMARVAAMLDTIPGKLRRASNRLTVADLDVVAGVLAEVRNAAADMEIPWFGDDSTEDIDGYEDDTPAEAGAPER